MKFLIVFILFLELINLHAQTNSNEEKTELIKSGLKKINYQNETNTSKTSDLNLTLEQKQKLEQDIEAFKKKQIESQKILEELDKEE